MRTIFDADLGATVNLDDAGRIRGLKLEEYRAVPDAGKRDASSAYLVSIAERLDIASAALGRLYTRSTRRISIHRCGRPASPSPSSTSLHASSP